MNLVEVRKIFDDDDKALKFTLAKNNNDLILYHVHYDDKNISLNDFIKMDFKQKATELEYHSESLVGIFTVETNRLKILHKGKMIIDGVVTGKSLGHSLSNVRITMNYFEISKKNYI